MSRILPIPMGVGPTPGEYYTAAEIDAMLANYAQLITTDLVNYYTKEQTLTTSEIQALVGQITSFEVVATLPVSDIKTNVIYLLGPIGSGADRYEEYIYSNSTWTKIGETSIDLSNYVTITQLNSALGFYTPTAQLAAVATGGEIGDLTDVSVSSPSNGQVLKYNSTSQKWENATGGGGGSVVELTQAQYDALANPDPDTTYIITDADAIDMDDYATQADMETVQTALAGKADKQNVTANTGSNKFPHWNEQGVITGAGTITAYTKTLSLNNFTVYKFLSHDSANWPSIWAPVTSGTAGQVLQSNGNGSNTAPSWVNIETLTGGLKFWLGTQAQYDALAPNYDSSTLYVISD